MAMKKILFVALLVLIMVVSVPVVFAQNQTAPSTLTPTFEQVIQIVSFITIFAGVLARAFLPYLRKWLADEPIGGFQKRYIAIMIVSFVTAWLSWPNFSAAFTSWWQILTASFVFGFGLQATYTEVYSWIESAVIQEQAATPAATKT